MNEEAQRCDVWLFRARLFKSRALAAQFVEAGKLRIERPGAHAEKLKKPSGLIRPGDRLIYVRSGRLIRLHVLGLGHRRGPASEAQALYQLGADDSSTKGRS